MTEDYESKKLEELCSTIRALCDICDYEKGLELIRCAMADFPNAAIPHNLMGIVLEKMGDHLNAMKHFRASIALDPAYEPSNQNLQTYGTFFSDGKCAFDESDVYGNKYDKNSVYNQNGFGYGLNKKQNLI